MAGTLRNYLVGVAGNPVTSFPQIYDASQVALDGNGTPIATGCLRALKTTDFGSITATINSVGITGNPLMTISNAILAVSGNFASTVYAVAITGSPVVTIGNGVVPVSGTFAATIGNIAVTGGSINILDAANISAQSSGIAYLAAISGSLSNNLATAVYVTGGLVTTVDITGNLFLASMSGSLATLVANGNSNTTITGFNTGILLSVTPPSSLTTSNSTPSGVAYPFTGTNILTGQILPSNANRIMFFIQNTHTGVPLYVNLGNPASVTSFSMILNPSTVQGWAGSSFADDHYRGAVFVSGGSAIAWQM